VGFIAVSFPCTAQFGVARILQWGKSSPDLRRVADRVRGRESQLRSARQTMASSASDGKEPQA